MVKDIPKRAGTLSLAMGFLALLGGQLNPEYSALYGPGFGASLLVAANILAIGSLFWWVAASRKRMGIEQVRLETEIQTLKEALAKTSVDQTAELRQSEAQIRELNAELEQRVFERTTALAATNKRLQHDITERKRVERALRESEGRFRSLAASSPIGIFQTDLEGRCLYTNEQWQKTADFGLEESLGKGWVNAIHPEDRGSVSKEWADCTRARKEFSREFRFLTRQGQVRWVHSYAAAIVSRGEISGYVGTTEDITELKEALAKVKSLRGLLPICSGCKKIRDDKGYWNQIEFFIRDHSDANFSHGMCPECAREYFPGMNSAMTQKA